ncbi:MAG: carbohydrate ABC transporter permease [Rhodoferax sp.]|nr:carbohydrate ABC transporter permease [Rhodoferax sp.]MCP5182301.1 carbohydrate ABC transporter permease [Pseudomonadales bacterium]
MSRSFQRRLMGWLLHAVLAVAAFVVLLPLIWMVSTSFKTLPEIMSGELNLIPQHWAALENYAKAVGTVPVLRFMFNGLVVSAAILALQLLVAIPAAYALAKLRWRGRNAFLATILLCLMVPHQAPAIPVYIGLHTVGLINTYTALIAPFAFSAFGIFLLRQYFMTIPDDLIHAGRIDGMSESAILWRVVTPTAAPAIVAFAVFSVIAHWNDLFWPLIVVTTPELATPPRGIVFFRNDEFGTDYGAMMAMTVIVTLPLVLLFLLMQRRFVDGITMSGLKG